MSEQIIKQLQQEIATLKAVQQATLKIQQELQESQERWQLIIQATNEGIWDWNLRTNELFISPRWKEMLGYQDQELPNRFDTWKQLLHPQDVERVMEAVQNHLEGQTNHYQIEFRLRCQDGNYKWILSKGKALWNSAGKAIRMVGSHSDISDRKEEQILLRSLIDSIPDLIFCKDAQGVYKICNNAFEAFVGKPSQEIVGKTDFDLFPPEEALFFRENDRIMREKKRPHRNEEWITYPDGSRRLLDTLKTPFCCSEGKLMGVIGISRDITDRKQKENTVKKQAKRDSLLSSIARQLIDQDFNTAVNFTLEALGHFTDGDRGYIIRYSPQQRLWNMTHEWCNYQVPSTLQQSQNIPVEYLPWFSRQLLNGQPICVNSLDDLPPQAIAERVVFKNSLNPTLVVVPMVTAGQTVGYLGFDANSSKIWTQEEVNLLKLVGEFIAIAQARSQAEDDRKESEARFAGILDNANEAIISIDEQQQITLFNHAAEKTFGYQAVNVLGQPFNQLIPPRFQDSHYQYVEDFSTCLETSRQMVGRRPVFGRRQDGSEFLAEVSISKIQLKGRKLFTAIVRDITERQQAEEALKQAKEAADAANRAKSEFLASMSHELRTPLNAILGFTQVMRRDRTLNPEHQQNLSIISRSGEHLLELINDILEMSKIEAGRTTFHSNSFDLYRLLDNLEAMLHLKAQEKGLQLIFERTPEVPQYLETDEGKLRQVLINLLGNAIKFTEEGGVTLRVKSEVRSRKGGFRESATLRTIDLEKPALTPIIADSEQIVITFEVEDSGPGIAPEEVDQLFAAFGQTETGRQAQEGTGLGLPISRKFVQLMGGNISVSSILGQGSLFAFSIKAKLTNASAIKTPKPIRKVVGLAPGQPQYRILSVDDRLESRLLLVKLLSSMGFEVRQASNGKEALEIWETWEPHLIWMDMRMPIIDGYQATQRIKATTKGQGTVVIALTASAFEEERNMVLSAGCDDFMRKPFREEVLWEKIAQHLGVRYIYESLELEQAQGREIEENPTDNPDYLLKLLSQMSPDWVNQLHQVAVECSDDGILELISKIPSESQPLAITLKGWADNFLFDQVIQLTQNLLNKQAK
ncbi:multi-sensor hybrid histidine kinase [Rippkaea orientalis PCC 8801]|uniref:Circadian input-output histidine kinase CikA n=1 Tax=Rippkaea orientalis (strain PCC 8801 / RF-1) TaxID=41431 RepID=B7K3J6_RIPO1|nr:PAS domain S-box protein [Rippkaea orientalis]ACK65338.1 multi-sensor hybrid histidine kinase [Rippkaea orientalis PCC 8801]